MSEHDQDWGDAVQVDQPTVLLVSDDTDEVAAEIGQAGFLVSAVAAVPDEAQVMAANILVVTTGVVGAETLISKAINTPFGPRVIVAVGAHESDESFDWVAAGAHGVVRSPLRSVALLPLIRRFVAQWYRARQLALRQSIAEQVMDLAIGTDQEDCLVYANAGALQVLGKERAEVLGVPIGTLLTPVGQGAVDGVEEFRVEPDGEDPRWIRGGWRMVRDPANRPLLRLLVAQDITRERQLRRDMVRSGALAELGMMAAEVAHEVNNPATYLMTNLSMLRDDLTADRLDPHQAMEMIEECLDGVARITDIVRRMRSLATSSAEEGTDTLVDLGMVVRDVCRIAGLRVKYKAELHIFDAEGVTVRASPKRIGQVVLNLVINASDALTGQIEPLPRIDVTIGRNDDWACIDVRDNGPGIPEKVAARMFDAFYTSKTSEGGTGLGLAVSRTIADEHGGALVLMPHEERGAWFRLRLPVLKV